MPTLRHHYERAFHRFLRDQRLPHVAVDDARRACLPRGATLEVTAGDSPQRLKSFDFLVYGPSRHLIIELKGRRVASRSRRSTLPALLPLGQPSLGGFQTGASGQPAPAPPRLDPWVTIDDLEALAAWRTLFGPGHEAAIVFCFWCDEPFAGSLFHDGAGDVIAFRGRWYAIRAITLDAYQARMRTRSPKWRTVCIRQAEFDAASVSLGRLLE